LDRQRISRVPGESPLGQRIAIVGAAASGKSRLAQQLGRLLNKPVVELDALYWEPGWRASSDAVFRERVAAATAGVEWIVDGHYERVWASIWPNVDTVIWLDLPLRVLLWRGFIRSWKRIRDHELLWGTNRESITRQLQVWNTDKSLVGWLLASYGGRRQAYVTATVDPRWSHIRFIRICSSAELTTMLAALERFQGG